jgi:hypothetical protein
MNGSERVMPGASLQRGDQVPHFEITTIDGAVVRYSTIWQQQNLVLVMLPDASGGASRTGELAAAADVFRQRQAACLVTTDLVDGLPCPGVVVADRWGEIVYVTEASRADALPPASDLLEWLDYVEQRCPECEGEAK